MAEGLARLWIEKNNIQGWKIESAGTFAGNSLATSEETTQSLKQFGIVYSGSSQPLTPEISGKAAAIICMTSSHCMDAALLTTDSQKIERLDLDADISDPIGCDQSVYDALAEQMYILMNVRLPEIIKRFTKINKD